MLLTLSSGITRYTTIHARSAGQALARLRFVCQLAETSGGMLLSALSCSRAGSIDVVVSCARTSRGPLLIPASALARCGVDVGGGQTSSTRAGPHRSRGLT